MTFTTTNLVGNRVLVKGTDKQGVDGEVVLDSSQWVEIHAHKDFERATAEFEADVEKFFAPITAAQEKMAAAMQKKVDDLEVLVLEEPVEGTPGTEGRVVQLNRDSQILRLIEEGKADDRLVWVNDTLEITEAPAPKKARARKAS